MIALSVAMLSVAPASRYFAIRVVDESTGCGVPLVELKTVNKQRFFTDSDGYIAFDEPGLMNRTVFFFIASDGYEFPKDGFGYRGEALLAKAGASATIKLKRLNIAERLCRLTGQGIYRDSELLGEPVPIENPQLDGGVMGQDTAQAETYKGRMIWFWGDTDRPGYPLGNFHTTGAFATFPKGKTDASEGLDFHYFTGGDGFVRPMVLGEASHPIWISGLTEFGSGEKQELYAYYAQMKSLGEILESGYLLWDDAHEQFRYAKRFAPDNGWRFMDGHVVTQADYAVSHFPPTVRVPADAAHLLDPTSYEAFSCLKGDGTVSRDPGGQVLYRWQKEVEPIEPRKEQELVKAGSLKLSEAHFLPLDEAGQTIFPHGGSVHWNAFRKKWIAVFTRLGGKDSELGDIYYSEADAPTGPFRRAVRIITHSKYTFYNPVQHAFLDRDGGRTIYLEGTYTAEFSGNDNPTPMYNYNQILYRVDLSDPRLGFAESESR